MAKKISVYIINFFLVIILFALTTTFILSNTALNKKYIQKVLEKKDYYGRTYSSIEKEFKFHTMQSGLEDSIVEGLYSSEKVRNDINMIVEAIYENKEISIETESIRKTLDDRITSVLAEKNRTPDSEELEAINVFEKAITDAYINAISYSEETVDQIGNAVAKILPVLTFIKLALIVITALLAFAIIFINKNIKESIKTFGITVLTVGLLNIIIKIFIGDRTHKILVLNQAFSQSLIELINSVVNKFLILGIVMTILGLGAMIIPSIIQKEK